MKKILVINAGSSSVKWTLFDKETLNQIANGLAERIGVDGNLILTFKGTKTQKQIDMTNHEEAVKEILNFWKANKVIDNINEIIAIGYRVVHGGNYFTNPIKINDDVLNKIDECSMYAPLHNPGAIAAIKAFIKVLPKVDMVAHFDTSFHQTIEKVNYSYPINDELVKKLGIRKFGFHGISHHYISEKMKEILKKENVNFVNLHIGNGASLCAIKDNKSIDTTMGLTPLAGVMMGTRSGDIDPSIHEFVMSITKMSIGDFTNILNKESGLLGVSGVSSDLRDIHAAISIGNKQAEFTLNLYVQRVVDYTIAYANKVGKNIDAIVFTAGVGENDYVFRKMVVDKLELLNITIDEEKNMDRNFDQYSEISVKNSKIKVFVVRTNEELMIAKECIKLI